MEVLMNTSSTHLLALSSVARRGQCCLQLLETVIVDVIHTQQSGIHDFCLLQCFCCTLNQVKLSNQGREFKLHVQVDPRRWKRNSMASNVKWQNLELLCWQLWRRQISFWHWQWPCWFLRAYEHIFWSVSSQIPIRCNSVTSRWLLSLSSPRPTRCQRKSCQDFST